MKRVSMLCLAFALLTSVATSQKRPFTIADLYSIRDVSDPQFSPDGRRIAFVVREDNLQEGTSNSDIYVINADGSGLRRMTTNPASDTHPRWSPDGLSLLFVSSRKDGSQAWQMPADGGEPHQLTSISTGVSTPVWSPDGKRILFATDVLPECGDDDSCNKKLMSSMTDGPLQAIMADSLLYRHWNEWKEGKRTHVMLFDLATKSTRDLTPGDFDSPSFTAGTVGFGISPDGTELCVVSNREGNEAVSTNDDLWIIPLAGGPARNITDGNQAWDGDPRYSPDGRHIAYRMQTIPGYEADRYRIAVFDRAAGTTRILSETFDDRISDLSWSPDGKEIIFSADVQGHVPLFALTVATGAIRQVIDAKTVDAVTLHPDGTTLAIVRRSVGEPRELWRTDMRGKNLRRLTVFNKALEDSVDIRPAEELWIPSPTGKRIHTFVVKPHGFDPKKKYPLILNVHGGPQSQWADAFRGDWQVYPGSGYVVAFPNPHGSTGYGQEFTAAISKDWGGKVYEDVMAVTDSLSRLPWVDAERMGAMGWSYGGYMMMWLQGHTTRFKAIVSMMGTYNLKAFHGTTEELWFPEWDLGGLPWESGDYEKFSPNNFAASFATPCLVITGERDYRVSYNQSLEYFTDLQRRGVPSRLIVFKNDGHWPSHVKSMPFYYNAHLDWFHRYLGGPTAPYDMGKMLRNRAFEKE